MRSAIKAEGDVSWEGAVIRMRTRLHTMELSL